jgi:hypothetical protein
MKTICRLCQREADLLESHVVPAFVFKWLKDTSPTPFMRTSREPNRRVQDGLTQPWLCSDCEQALGTHEAQFASKIFHPTTQNGSHKIRYDESLLKFCVSISWRALLLASDKHPLDKFSETQRAAAAEALQAWNGFLRGLAPQRQ